MPACSWNRPIDIRSHTVVCIRDRPLAATSKRSLPQHPADIETEKLFPAPWNCSRRGMQKKKGGGRIEGEKQGVCITGNRDRGKETGRRSPWHRHVAGPEVLSKYFMWGCQGGTMAGSAASL